MEGTFESFFSSSLSSSEPGEPFLPGFSGESVTDALGESDDFDLLGVPSLSLPSFGFESPCEGLASSVGLALDCFPPALGLPPCPASALEACLSRSATDGMRFSSMSLSDWIISASFSK